MSDNKMKNDKIKYNVDKKNKKHNKNTERKTSAASNKVNKNSQFYTADNEFRKKDFEDTKLSKYRFNLIEVIIIMVITVLFGLFIGSIIAYTKPKEKEVNCKVDDNKFITVYNSIINEYSGDIDKEKLLDDAIKGMISSLGDPYSSFMNKEEAKNYNDELSGKFFGIGVEVSSFNNSLPNVVSVYDNGPAFKAGVLSGDIIYKVDGNDLTGLGLEEITYLIKDETKENVNLTLVRNGSEVVVDVKKEMIDIKSVSSYFTISNNKKIGVIVISNFSKNTLKQFEEVYNTLKNEDNVEALIVDVRNNSGGYLSAARDISSLFLNPGSVVYQKVIDGKGEKITTNLNKLIDIPVAVVVNESTASAAEIFAAALNENLNVPIIGTKTYGKATVQKLMELSDGSFVKFTVQNWLTANGNSINGVGIVPNYEIVLDNNYYNSPSLQNDLQMQKALSILSE